MFRLEPPAEQTWRTITYHPQPFATRTRDPHALEYWRGVYGPNTCVEVREEVYRTERDSFMRNLIYDLPILVFPDPERVESYVEPLAEIHGRFFDAASALCWAFHPPVKPAGRKWHSPVHSLLSEMYWTVADWHGYTPASWVVQLNCYLELAELHRVRSEVDLARLRGLCLAATTHRQANV